jgi:hypothetical protein
MTLLDAANLRAVLEQTTRDLFRFEQLPAYEVASDGSDFRRYLDGAQQPTWDRKQPWLDTLRTWTAQGRIRRRVRLIHDPITDYERYACEWGYALNSQAGEDIRIIDLATTPLPTELTGLPDFWLVDGEDVVCMHYDPAGRFIGAAVLASDEVVPYQRAARVAWQESSDFATWWDAHPKHHRSPSQVA